MLTKEQEQWREFRLQGQRNAIASLKAKIASGEYPLEEAPCFCGANDDQELKTHDRLGVQHRVVICKKCAIVRANPRMTAEAYNRFYNEEYRQFTYRYLTTDPANQEEEYELIRKKQRGVAEHIQKLLVDEDLGLPESIVDIGCYLGGMLDYFKDKGTKYTYGVEINEEAVKSNSERGHVMAPSVDALIEQGVKVDFVIMQDVIEHLLDLREVKKVAQILKPEGRLFIFTPGMFRTDPRDYWQVAHTWYFVANTFGWLMEELGFTPTYIDEDITSFWQWQGETKSMPPPDDWVEYIVDEAEGKEERRLPPFRGVCKFTKKLLYDNMRRNFAMQVPDFHNITDTRQGPVVIVGGGPSIDGQVEALRGLKEQGIPVIAIARMYPWCLERGITPDYVISLDCSEEQEKGFEVISKATTHLVSSVTRPEIVQKILDAGAPCYLFDSRDDRKIKTLRRDAGYNQCTVINSGGTVVITGMSTAFTLGFTALHIFGFDCLIPDPHHTHATGIAGKSVNERILPIDIEGEILSTTPAFIEYARQALDLFSVAHEGGFLTEVKVYGESLISKMWDCQWHEEEAA